MHRVLDLDLLRTLVVVAESGSISAAASRLYRSQSAISDRVRKLELNCGLSLLARGKSGATLTPAGERLIVNARKMLALSDVVLRDLHAEQVRSELRFAVTKYFRPLALPGIITYLEEHFPQLRLRLCVQDSASIECETHSGNFDIGLSMAVLHNGYVTNLARGERRKLQRESMHWVANRSFSLSQGEPLPLIVLPETCSLQRFIGRVLDEHRIAYSIAHIATDIGGLHLALAAGLGVACLNASAIPPIAAPLDCKLPLPSLPDVEFGLVPARRGEPSFVSEVRHALARRLNSCEAN
ncbi:LysR family transcriptional regulator [Paraburkholderia caribensis]|uniref:LysR family transcriptional regulator n=1 Tax=Paraburkholderia caribensis TaxID=75105 RepID=UPI001CB08B2C|nr:LysR family transcriptional regulator [Paraburkholderia caribensis]CAG9261653.1 Transcriptional regulator, LysR family [Paraburkholderia caribensis]